jgi:hypothetical protein
MDFPYQSQYSKVMTEEEIMPLVVSVEDCKDAKSQGAAKH